MAWPSWLIIDETERRRFEDRWNNIDRVFKPVQWSVVVAIVFGAARSLFDQKAPVRGVLVALVALALLVVIIIGASALPAAWLDSHFPPGDKRRFWIVRGIVGLFLAFLVYAFSEVTFAIVKAQAFHSLTNPQ